MAEKSQWVITIRNELQHLADTSSQSTHWSKKSIYRIPISVTELHKRAYKPQIVSFGPYHNGLEYLLPMEEHKHRALRHFLKRADKPINSFVEALSPMVQDLREAYDRLDPKWERDDDAFLNMMIMDGCFILEVLRTTMVVIEYDDLTSECVDEEDYAYNDPIFSNHGRLYIVPYLKRDMLMLENQIPMVVLDTLVSVQGRNASFKGRKQLIWFILKFFSQSILPKNLRLFQNPLHILDIYRTSLLLKDPHPKKHTKKLPKPPHHKEEQIIRSATELNEAGIRIKKKKTRILEDISFHNGILKLPFIVVDDTFESLYLNLIAFERFHVGAGNDVTSYIFFMNNIIVSARDVSLLHSCGIIQNALVSDEAVVNLFKSLSKDITLDPESRLDEVLEKVSDYCQKPWNQWRSNLIHTYFNRQNGTKINSWVVLSVFGGVLLFALAFLQTIFTVLSYVKPPH